MFAFDILYANGLLIIGTANSYDAAFDAIIAHPTATDASIWIARTGMLIDRLHNDGLSVPCDCDSCVENAELEKKLLADFNKLEREWDDDLPF